MGSASSKRVVPSKNEVFLGGVCDPTTWRFDIAIPALEAAAVTYYNPQVSDWNEGLIAIEENAKENATVLLFVINTETRGLASIVESAIYSGLGQKKVVIAVVGKFEGTEPVNMVKPDEFKDINRCRTYLVEIVKKKCPNAMVFSDIDTAIKETIKICKNLK